MIPADRNDLPPDAGAASARKDGSPQNADRRGGRGGGLFVTVSRQRLDYSRPLIQPSANSNSPPSWTPARIAGMGEFRAAARLASTPCDTTAMIAAFRHPVRPVMGAAEPVADVGSGEATNELGGLLEAIAAEVNARAGIVCDGIAAEFAGRIRQAKRLPKHLAAAEIAALRQAKKAAVKFVRESAATEIMGRQKQARVMFRQERIKPILNHNNWDNKL